MAHSYTEMNESAERLEKILEVALGEARTMERHALRSGIFSPSPAEAVLVRRTVADALALTRMKIAGPEFVPEMIPGEEHLAYDKLKVANDALDAEEART